MVLAITVGLVGTLVLGDWFGGGYLDGQTDHCVGAAQTCVNGGWSVSRACYGGDLRVACVFGVLAMQATP